MQMWRLLTKMRNGKKYSLRSEATREEPATVAANIILTSRQLCERTELRRAPVEDVIALTCFHQASLCPSLCLGFKRTGYKTDDVRTKVKLSLNASKAWKPKVALRWVAPHGHSSHVLSTTASCDHVPCNGLPGRGGSSPQRCLPPHEQDWGLSLPRQCVADTVYLILLRGSGNVRPGEYNCFPLCLEAVNYFQLY
ncbi:uncharacterized protein LOC121070315 isoform X2 [Cygnus olor]|uniref:uncharacterized protein LOC121070315 isoform X2 n=1 Tax=Cygnus olor TaxID=8869 RepID=UPI001ADE2610|nr:uncharacterized protein LOC121070315 isoform X2 [Cygnus olor]